jgi:hypothetical protein
MRYVFLNRCEAASSPASGSIAGRGMIVFVGSGERQQPHVRERGRIFLTTRRGHADER